MAPRSAWAGSAAALLALTLLGSSAIASGGAALSPTVPPVSLPAPAALPRALASPVAAASSPYLFVEGIEYESEEGEVAIPPANLIADFVLPSTTYPTAWSLSGLSSTGDRFLTWAAFDFPYSSGTCPSTGYTMGYEVQTSAGSSLGSQCAPSFSPSSGDSMELTENLACGGTIGSLCLTLADLTLGRSYTPAVSQPTPTATYFQNTNPAAPNSHQYFTGAETIVDDALAPSGCLSFSGMPTVTYYLQGELPTSSGSGPGFQEENLSSYQVFASETDPTPALCASYLSSVERAPSTILTQYLPGGGVSDGAHWLAFQNWTRAVGRASMGRFQTDVFPVTGSMKVSRTSGDDGQYLVASVTAGGGVPPFTCQWSVDGATLAGTACSVNLTVNGNGPENLSAFAIDAARDDALAWTTFTAYTDPTVAVPIASPSSVDLGQSVRFSATVVGGSGGVTYAWSGLPSGCTSATSTAVTCTPTAAGTAHVLLSLNDSAGVSATSGPLAFTTSTDPTVRVAATPGTPTAIDVGQPLSLTATVGGGAGADRFVWSLLPPGCSSTAAVLACRPSAAGNFSVSLNVTDANGFSVDAAPLAVNVSSLPSVTVTLSDPSPVTGANLTIGAVVRGGAGELTYAWSGLPPGCTLSTGPDVACALSSPGQYNAAVTVADRDGGTGTGNASFTVGAAPSLGAGTEYRDLGWIGVGVAVVLAAAAVVLLLRRRRGRDRPPPGYVITSGPRIVPPGESDRRRFDRSV